MQHELDAQPIYQAPTEFGCTAIDVLVSNPPNAWTMNLLQCIHRIIQSHRNLEFFLKEHDGMFHLNRGISLLLTPFTAQTTRLSALYVPFI
jgi:hypothetical protein